MYKFCEVLDDILDKELSHQYMDLVALGEIADVMDRTNPETNYLMLQGLSNIYNKGFQTLLAAQAYSLKEKAYPPWPKLNAIDIAFYIAPLINAIVRVGTMEEKELPNNEENTIEQIKEDTKFDYRKAREERIIRNTEKKILKELGVESFDSVKETLKNHRNVLKELEAQRNNGRKFGSHGSSN